MAPRNGGDALDPPGRGTDLRRPTLSLELPHGPGRLSCTRGGCRPGCVALLSQVVREFFVCYLPMGRKQSGPFTSGAGIDKARCEVSSSHPMGGREYTT